MQTAPAPRRALYALPVPSPAPSTLFDVPHP